MKRTGELLRKSREEKGLSVHEVGLFLKINPRILQAIEEGDQKQLPAKTFLRGFIQSYAKFLKLDSQEVLHIFSEETATSPKVEDVLQVQPAIAPQVPDNESSPEKVQASTSTPEIEKKKSEPTDSDSLKNSILTKSSAQNDALRVRTFAISVIGLILVFAIYFVNSVIKKYQREGEVATDVNTPAETASSETVDLQKASEAPKSQPTEANQSHANTTSPEASSNSSSAPIASPPSSTPPASAPVDATVAHQHKPAAPPSAPANSSATSPTAPVPKVDSPTASPSTAVKPTTPNPTAPAVAQKPASNSTVGSATTLTTTASPTTAKVPEGKLTEVIVEANQNVEIEYSSNKSSPQKLALKADQVHTFKSRSGVKLKISNGGAVNIIVNGQDRGAPGAAGQSIQVAYE